MNKIKKGAFTLIELIVVITILAILSVIAFISFTGIIQTARNSTRVTDIKTIENAIGYYKAENSKFPKITNPVSITYSGGIVWTQGIYGEESRRSLLSTSSEVTDPLLGSHYSYSITSDGKQFQIGGIIEGNKGFSYNNLLLNTANANIDSENISTILKGNYNDLLTTVSTGGLNYIVAAPSITTTNIISTDYVDIVDNGNLVYNNSSNIPYTLGFVGKNIKPLSLNKDKILLFTGSIDKLDSQENRLILINNLSQAYSGSILNEKDLLLKKLSTVQIDINNPNSLVNLLSCYLVNNNLDHRTICTELDFISYFVTEVLNIDLLQLPGSKINGVQQDSDGNLWFATDAGLAMFGNDTWNYYNEVNSDLIDDNVSSLSEDINNILWFGTNKGISTYDRNTDTWTSITTSDGLLHNHILSINTSDNGNIWIGTNKGVSLYNNDSWTSYTQKKKSIGLSNIHVNIMYEDSTGIVWFATQNGLDKFNISTNEITDTYKSSNTSGINNDNFTYILEDFTNNIWLGTENGLSFYNRDTDSWILYSSSNSGLIGNNIKYLFIDSSNFMWIGTDSGVSKYDINANTWVENFDTSNQLSGNNIYTIYEDENNDILILNNGGLDTISN